MQKETARANGVPLRRETGVPSQRTGTVRVPLKDQTSKENRMARRSATGGATGTPRWPGVPLPLAGTCLLALLLAACGGGSSGSGDVADTQAGVEEVADTSPAPPAPPATEDPAPGSGETSPYNLGSTSQAVIEQCMSEADLQMLTQVNHARARSRDCGSDHYPAAAALAWHCTLEDVAAAHSRDMGDHNFFSHTGSDGLTVGDRVTNAGYAWSGVGENIAAGQQDIDAVMGAWLDSPGHCANLMQPAFTEIGMSVYSVTGSDYPIYWTQVFAAPRR